MTESQSEQADEPTREADVADTPLLAEDLLLLLFQPDAGFGDAGAIAGEGTLYYVLAGAVLADLGFGGNVTTTSGRFGGVSVEAVAENPPGDTLLRKTWDYVADKARGVQTVLAATGPELREPLLDRLVARGDIERTTHKRLVFTTSSLHAGDSSRRDGLMADVRAALVDGVEPTPRVGALAALLYGSGTLPQFDADIPWTSAVIARAEALRDGAWAADAAAEAVTRTITATIVGSVVAAVATAPRT